MRESMRNFEDVLALNQPEVAERLMRALELKGDLPELLRRTLDASVTLDDLTLPEYWWLRRGTYFDGGGSAVASPGNYGRVAFGAPQTSAVIAVVEAVHIINQTAGQLAYRVGLQFNGLNTANADQKPRDSRMTAASRSAFTITGDTSAVNQLVNNASLFVNVPANNQVIIPGPWIVAAQQGITATAITRLLVETSVVNQGIDVWFRWRERAQLDTER